MSTQEEIEANIAKVKERIAAAAARSGRNADEITLVAVSKTHPAERLREAIAAGAAVLGENKVQEAEPKILSIGRDLVKWHLIGHLQSNKARKAVQLFDVIHSVDSRELARRLDRVCEEEGRDELSVLVQVDIAGESTKSGVPENSVADLAELFSTLKRIKLVGLMVLPPFFDEPEKTRPFFTKLRKIRDDLYRQGAFAGATGELSMGMSHDFEIAIEEGSTMIRVGTSIFGSRGE